ncbi:hypothetical protein FALBO_1378 [Fusarium albosuccineum]|uniref:Uncharacterized protein n=1 Tax=Fusarium albosuccineum TaxID=1237068 RepID=A0A8H4PII1_9HYPO|nr:hypothetical protein FALBO_1378 [Fusarium albosuccineum]
MARNDQTSGESSPVKEPEDSGYDSESDNVGELEDLRQGTVLVHGESKQARRLPLTREDVNEICKSRPSQISLWYLTLNPEELPESLGETWKLIQEQENWLARIFGLLIVRGYEVDDKHGQILHQAVPYSKAWSGLESCIEGCTANSNSSHQAFQVRTELKQASLTPELCE